MRQNGYSLVEIMVGITLGLILLAGVVSVVYSSKLTYYENERVARLQESGRAALDIVLRDLRGAGFPGCAQPLSGLLQINNLLSNSNTLLWNFTSPMQGFEATSGAWSPTLNTTIVPNAVAGNDIFAVRTIRSGSPLFRTTALTNPNDANVVVSKADREQIMAGTPVIISDCGSATVFVASGFTDDGATATLTRATTGGPPTNASTNLLGAFTAGAQVAPVATVIYYIRNSASGTGPALWRVVGNGGPEELIQGVEGMQVEYGVDTNGDTFVDNYVRANAVTDWNTVASVSIAMLIRSLAQDAPSTDEQTYDLLGTDFGPYSDRRQRKLFTTTIALRNRTT